MWETFRNYTDERWNKTEGIVGIHYKQNNNFKLKQKNKGSTGQRAISLKKYFYSFEFKFYEGILAACWPEVGKDEGM